MADTQWTRASDGSVGVFPGESGMVGTPGPGVVWAMWMPRPGVTYSASYWGRELSVKNLGTGNYELTKNGVTFLVRYSSSFRAGLFYDAQGNPIASADAARVKGDPSQIYFQPGDIIENLGTSEVARPVQPPTPPAQAPTPSKPAPTATQPAANAPRTRSSDGRTDVYAGDSGMVGVYDQHRHVWALYMPAPGVEYVSYYQGGDIALRNNGDGSYWLDADGTRAKRLYAARWKPGVFYDGRGREVSSAAQATATGDPSDLFFIPGPVVEGFTPTTGGTLPPPVTTGGNLPPPVSTGGNLPPVDGGGVIIPTPGPADFPDTGTDPTGPGTTGAQISGKMLALAAAAAFAFLS